MRDWQLPFCLLFFWSCCTHAQEQEEPYPWLDDMHRSIAESVQDSAQWVDDFFADTDWSEDESARGEARLRLGWEPRTRDLNEFEARLRVRVRLPAFENKVDLILSDYDDEIPDDKVRAGREADVNRNDRFSLAIRYRPDPESGFSHRLGIGRRLQLFARSRYRTIYHLSEKNDLRWEASISYYNRDRFGAHTELIWDHRFDEDALFRFDNRFYFRDKTDDWLWQHSWQYYQWIDGKNAIVAGFYIEGLSKPDYRLEEYLTSVRWRRNAVREWLFFEVEPFILWRRDEQFSASYGVALRVEGYFGKYD